MAVKTFNLRDASKYLTGKGVDVSELRMRTLVNQHEIFVNDPDTAKQTIGDSESKQWRVSQKALDQYLKAAAAGTVRTTTGAKAYKISVTAEQLASLRDWAQAHGVADPARANKTYTKKGKGEAPEGNAQAEGDAVGSDTIASAFGAEDDGVFDEEIVEA